MLDIYYFKFKSPRTESSSYYDNSCCDRWRHRCRYIDYRFHWKLYGTEYSLSRNKVYNSYAAERLLNLLCCLQWLSVGVVKGCNMPPTCFVWRPWRFFHQSSHWKNGSCINADFVLLAAPQVVIANIFPAVPLVIAKLASRQAKFSVVYLSPYSRPNADL